MRVLALDFGGVTGWAIGKYKGADASGTWDIVPRRGESPGMRYIHLRRKLEEIYAAYPDLGLVIYEMAHMRGGAASEYGIGCSTTLQAWCAERGFQYTTVHSATLKKWATGKGNAKKPDMMAAATKRGWTFSGDDEADALWILDYALHEVVGK